MIRHIIQGAHDPRDASSKRRIILELSFEDISVGDSFYSSIEVYAVALAI